MPALGRERGGAEAAWTISSQNRYPRGARPPVAFKHRRVASRDCACDWLVLEGRRGSQTNRPWQTLLPSNSAPGAQF